MLEKRVDRDQSLQYKRRRHLENGAVHCLDLRDVLVVVVPIRHDVAPSLRRVREAVVEDRLDVLVLRLRFVIVSAQNRGDGNDRRHVRRRRHGSGGVHVHVCVLGRTRAGVEIVDARARGRGLGLALAHVAETSDAVDHAVKTATTIRLD